MAVEFVDLRAMFLRTKQGIHEFMSILQPRIENAKDDHERLYYHHIFEEEEQRLDRLNALLPTLDYYIDNAESRNSNDFQFIRLLQDISLEKFGLHNFLEHLDLALFSFKDPEHQDKLTKMRNITADDYQTIKVILESLNENFDGAANAAGSTPTDEKEDVDASLKIDKYTSTTPKQGDLIEKPREEKKTTKRLTVGSLKGTKEVM
ncbi:IMEF encapsulin system ferritin-like cargo protein [Anaerobacillus isosaccharinicus]|uniref:IMEF encapsulin system ferritin-like cargo protein n=2 Tax=Anaerobacillus isosaccharinicus TaxID=1532552 RepID=A0A7S7RBD9_9BACI|nr:IMEF encapsulin system ferritin-like cargo protein [Anaerobacillus isosaccharinicus]MBA5585931.1 hypothetical protein [Anaerobacillus isosaccharinicus]QOY35781.1 hypothetical protein AWH56_024515 [Anaerobacillus isosaccharinicus]